MKKVYAILSALVFAAMQCEPIGEPSCVDKCAELPAGPGRDACFAECCEPPECQ